MYSYTSTIYLECANLIHHLATTHPKCNPLLCVEAIHGGKLMSTHTSVKRSQRGNLITVIGYERAMHGINEHGVMSSKMAFLPFGKSSLILISASYKSCFFEREKTSDGLERKFTCGVCLTFTIWHTVPFTNIFSNLLDNFGHNSGAHSSSTFADGELKTFFHGDWVD